MIGGQEVIILEGPDGCGKTNIGLALAKNTSIPYFKVNSEHENWRNGRFKEALEFDQTYISQFLQQTKHSCIIDRAYPSEWVYSDVFDRESNDHVLFEVDKRFAELGAIIVICRRHDYSSVKDELVESSHLIALDETYKAFVAWTECSVVEIFVDDFQDDIALQLPKIINAIGIIQKAKKEFNTVQPIKLRVK